MKLLNGYIISSPPATPSSAKLVPPEVTDLATYVVSGNNVHIQSSGTFDISSFSGYDIEVSSMDVRFIQTNSTPVENINIRVIGEYTNIFLDGLNIKETNGISKIDTYANSLCIRYTVNLIGNNNFERDIGPYGSPLYDVDPIICVYDGVKLTINEAYGTSGTLNINEKSMMGLNCAAIGGLSYDLGNSPRELIIAGGNININREIEIPNGVGGSLSNGPLIGFNNGHSYRARDTITITGGNINAIYDVSGSDPFCQTINGAIIGSGSDVSCPIINIYGGTINAKIIGKEQQSSIIGSGHVGGYYDPRAQINIYGGNITIDTSEVELMLSSAIGMGYESVGGADIKIYDGEINLIGDGVKQLDPITNLPIYHGKLGDSPNYYYYTPWIYKNGMPFENYYNSDLNSNCALTPSSVTVYGGKQNFTARDVNGIYIRGQFTKFQVGANGSKDQTISLTIPNMSASALGLGSSDILTREKSNNANQAIDVAINKVSSVRADLGALQNRLEHTIDNLANTSENLQAAESSIRDVDMAKEMMGFTKNNILIQAAQSMLAQANQLPQGVLSLLR